MKIEVRLSRKAEKDLLRMPRHICKALETWIASIELRGLAEVRKISGYHDEPLQGNRFGQRSVRLNRAYRLIYRILSESSEKIILIEEVSKHGY
jgi:proteic killer suppression protein